MERRQKVQLMDPRTARTLLSSPRVEQNLSNDRQTDHTRGRGQYNIISTISGRRCAWGARQCSEGRLTAETSANTGAAAMHESRLA